VALKCHPLEVRQKTHRSRTSRAGQTAGVTGKLFSRKDAKAQREEGKVEGLLKKMETLADIPVLIFSSIPLLFFAS